VVGGGERSTLTFRMIDRDWSSMNSTRTCVTPPLEPVRPRTLVTFASLAGWAFIVTDGLGGRAGYQTVRGVCFGD
jgi:hypothetical protein